MGDKGHSEGQGEGARTRQGVTQGLVIDNWRGEVRTITPFHDHRPFHTEVAGMQRAGLELSTGQGAGPRPRATTPPASDTHNKSSAAAPQAIFSPRVTKPGLAGADGPAGGPRGAAEAGWPRRIDRGVTMEC